MRTQTIVFWLRLRDSEGREHPLLVGDCDVMLGLSGRLNHGDSR